MGTKKACKNCKLIYEGTTCPECGSTEGVNNFKGIVYVFNTEKSEVSKSIKAAKPGEYAIKVR